MKISFATSISESSVMFYLWNISFFLWNFFIKVSKNMKMQNKLENLKNVLGKHPFFNGSNQWKSLRNLIQLSMPMQFIVFFFEVFLL